MERKVKERFVAELQKKLEATKFAVLADYSGMNVQQITALRNELRKADGEMKVVKNNLLSIAIRNTVFSSLDDYLEYPRALILNHGDVVETAKALVEFAKKNAKLDIKVGIMDGKLLTKEQISELSKLPSREVLLAKLLSVMVGAQTNLVGVLSAVPRSFVQVLEAYRVKKENEN